MLDAAARGAGRPPYPTVGPGGRKQRAAGNVPDGPHGPGCSMRRPRPRSGRGGRSRQPSSDPCATASRDIASVIRHRRASRTCTRHCAHGGGRHVADHARRQAARRQAQHVQAACRRPLPVRIAALPCRCAAVPAPLRRSAPGVVGHRMSLLVIVDPPAPCVHRAAVMPAGGPPIRSGMRVAFALSTDLGLRTIRLKRRRRGPRRCRSQRKAPPAPRRFLPWTRGFAPLRAGRFFASRHDRTP